MDFNNSFVNLNQSHDLKLSEKADTLLVNADASSSNDQLADVRILVVGDEGVGKTSIIMALLEDQFSESVLPCLDTILIPADVTPDGVITEIIDYSPRVQDEPTLISMIERANVICIVYSILEEKNIARITSYWLPLIQDVLGGSDHGRPVLLVANKSDRKNEVGHIEKMVKIMNDYLEIETVVESSAKILKNIPEIFLYAQKAVIYPFRPLFQVEERELTQKCRRALARIFKISDMDNDGLLSDDELKEFQMRCFGIPLTKIAVEGVKQSVMEHDSRNISDDSLTLEGFFFLHQMFIQRGKYDTVWAILKRFGYDLNLQLSQEYLLPKLTINRGCSTEISPIGLNFLTKLFRKYDEDRDDCLSPMELQKMFSLCPLNPWTKDLLNSVECNHLGWLTFNGYINLWILNFAINLPQTLEQLAYFGFNVEHKSQVNAVTITRERQIDVFEKTTFRKVFQCHVIGPKGGGKTVFCHSLINKPFSKILQLCRKDLNPYVINTVNVKDDFKHLVLHEVDVYSQNDLLTNYEKSADVICLLYDAENPNSFAYCATIYLRYFYRTKVPCLVVATKVENYEVEQNYEQQPIDFCLMHQLPKPVRFRKSDIGKSDAPVFSRLATMATYPHLKRVYFLQDSNLLSKITFGAAFAALAGFLIYKNL